MAIQEVARQNSRLMYERMVGGVTQDCFMPSMLDCIGIVGVAPAAMVCTHLTPGLNAQEYEDTWEALRNCGGNWAARWYVVGALPRHFGVSGFLSNRDDIRDQIRTAFNDDDAEVRILDASSEQADLPMNAIDFRFQRGAGGVTVSYARFGQAAANPGAFAGKNWTPFDMRRFTTV